MCKLEIFISRYADGDEVEKDWKTCPFCPQNRPWDCLKFYDDETKEHVYLARSSMSSRSSDTSSIRAPSIGAPSTVDSATRSSGTRRSSRREPRPFSGLFMDALMGDGRRRRSTRRSASRVRTSEIVIEDRLPRIYPATPSPTYRTSYESSQRFSASPVSPPTPMTPRFADSWENAVIVDASPLHRGRRGTPVIVENGRSSGLRSASTEAQAGRSTAPSRARTPEPDYRDARPREEQRQRGEQQAADQERRRLRREREARDRRAEQLEQQIAEGRARMRRQTEIELTDAAINARRARPIVQQDSPPRVAARNGILRKGSVRRARRESDAEDAAMAERGAQVLRDAGVAREVREREEAREAETRRAERSEAEMRRLGRRFGRVMYVDGEDEGYVRR